MHFHSYRAFVPRIHRNPNRLNKFEHNSTVIFRAPKSAHNSWISHCGVFLLVLKHLRWCISCIWVPHLWTGYCFCPTFFYCEQNQKPRTSWWSRSRSTLLKPSTVYHVDSCIFYRTFIVCLSSGLLGAVILLAINLMQFIAYYTDVDDGIILLPYKRE